MPVNDNLHPAAWALAEAIVESEPVISTFAACEWDCLSEDGQLWLARIVQETIRRTGGHFPVFAIPTGAEPIPITPIN